MYASSLSSHFIALNLTVPHFQVTYVADVLAFGVCTGALFVHFVLGTIEQNSCHTAPLSEQKLTPEHPVIKSVPAGVLLVLLLVRAVFGGSGEAKKEKRE